MDEIPSRFREVNPFVPLAVLGFTAAMTYRVVSSTGRSVVIEDEPTEAPNEYPVVVSPSRFEIYKEVLHQTQWQRDIGVTYLYAFKVKTLDLIDDLDLVAITITGVTGTRAVGIRRVTKTINVSGAEAKAGVDLTDFRWVSNWLGSGHFYHTEIGYSSVYVPGSMVPGQVPNGYDIHYAWGQMHGAPPATIPLEDPRVIAARIYRSIY